MKINEQPAGHGTSFKRSALRLKSLSALIRHSLAVSILFWAASAVHAQNVVWDASGLSTGGSDGSGIWEGSTNWFFSGSDQAWPGGATASTGPTAVIGAGVPGSYLLTLTAPESALFFTNNTSGYTLGGDELTLTSTTASATPGEFSIGTGVTLTVTNQIGMNGGYIVLGSGATLNYGGPKITAGGNARIYGQNLTSVVNLTNGFSEGGTLDLSSCTVNLYGGTFDSTGRVDLGRGVGYGNGQTTVNVYGGLFYASGSVSANNGHFQICRGNSAQCTLSVYPGTGMVASQNTFEISPDSGDVGTLNMSGGYLNVGSGGSAGTSGTPGLTQSTLLPLTLLTASSTGTQSAIMNVSGGVVTASEILYGGSGTYSANSTCQFNLSGGYVYLDAGGIQFAGGVSGLTAVTALSGGTLAATANWTGSVPLTLSGGTTTFQTGDTNGDPFVITLTGAITGSGNLNVTGSGVLTLDGADNYTGSSTVTSGTLQVNTASAPTIGPVIAQAGSTVSSVPAGTGQSWTCASLDAASGSTIDFNYGSFLPSSSQAPLVASGLVQLSASDTVTIEASTFYVGTYPLIQYGSFSGTLPASLTLPSGVTAILVNNIASKTIELVVSSTPVTITSVEWNVGSGIWNINSSLNWKNIATHAASTYQDGDQVEFFDDGQANPIVITLNTTVNPADIIANNVTNSFLITGSGGIGGASDSVTVQGSGLLALATTNTYAGGTTVSSGTLGINYGGDGLLNSAIGTGTLTLTNGGQIDNTSGKSVTLITPIAEFWYGSIGFVGSTNLTLGSLTTNVNAVPITLGRSVVTTISSNRLIVNSPIIDNGSGYSLTKRGAGALVLAGTNTFTGGVTLDVGELDINFGGDGGGDSAIGTGLLTLNGGLIDNTSGVWVTNVKTTP
jgi:autotransporter-associated beta strand protein